MNTDQTSIVVKTLINSTAVSLSEKTGPSLEAMTVAQGCARTHTPKEYNTVTSSNSKHITYVRVERSCECCEVPNK